MKNSFTLNVINSRQMITHNVRGWHTFLFAVFLLNDLFEFIIGPIVHGVIFVAISHINIHASLLDFTFHAQIMREFTLFTLSALTGFEERAHH